MEEGKMKPRIALLSNKIFVEERCVMCDEPFETGEILPELYDEDGHLIGYVCDACAYQPQSYASKLREQAEDLESLAEALQNSAVRFRQLADTGIEPPDADYRLELESLIAVGDSKETEKLNAVEQEKDLPAESVKGKKFLGLTWDEDRKKLVLLFEGDRILWIAPARKGEGDEELVVDTDAKLILGEGPRGDELIDHTEGYFGPAPGTALHKWS
ncbi:unnamed protein product [marine sediment metagenome]|uniref:Uncharacterized protein n=1 Tax=marine sediment metagenome TaxID=412755 RepID=X1M0Y2_9ZZZZ